MGRQKRTSAAKSGGDGEKPKKPKTGFTRVPQDIADMLSLIAEHELNGWTTPAQILGDKSCPLFDWLLPLHARALEEKHEAHERMLKERKRREA